MTKRAAICLVGWGAIGARVATLLAERASPVRIAVVAVRDAGRARDGMPEGAVLISDPADLAKVSQSQGLSLVVEAAGRASVLPWGRAALNEGLDFAVSSTSAFADDAALAELLSLAKSHAAQVLIPPGALGGIDALAAASRMGLTRVEHRIVKPATAWAGTPAADLIALQDLAEPVAFFTGTAREAADAFPQNANVAIITSLAGMGLDHTKITLVADPHATLNQHEIHAEGDFGRLELRLENRPLTGNPKSSEMTALNLVRLIENRVSPLVI